MQFLLIMSCLLLACSAAPTNVGPMVLNDKILNKDFVIYTGHHDIVKIFVPLNQFNYNVSLEDLDTKINSNSSSEETEPRTVFFFEADLDNGKSKQTDQGLYVYKNGKATKILDNGRDAAATNENVIYIGASNGIYKYNEASNTAVKHGAVTDDIVQMTYNKITNGVYYLTANHEVFKLNTDATASVKVSNIKNIQALTFGFEGNMYYYDTEKNMYVLSGEANAVPKKIEGLPSKIDKLTLGAPLFGTNQGAIVFVDKNMYHLNSDAKATKSTLTLEVQPTAFAPQPTLFQYYAKDKKLYELNMISIIKSGLLNETKGVFKPKQ